MEELVSFCVVFKATETSARGAEHVSFRARARQDVITKLTSDFTKGVSAGVYTISELLGATPRESELALRFSDVLYIS